MMTLLVPEGYFVKSLPTWGVTANVRKLSHGGQLISHGGQFYLFSVRGKARIQCARHGQVVPDTL